MLYVWYPKNRTDLKIIHEENDVIEMEELAIVQEALKQGKAYLFNYEDGTPKSLYDSLRSLRDPASQSLITAVTRLLSRDRITPMNLL